MAWVLTNSEHLQLGPHRTHGVAVTLDIDSRTRDTLRLWVPIYGERRWVAIREWRIRQDRLASYSMPCLTDEVATALRTPVREVLDRALPPF